MFKDSIVSLPGIRHSVRMLKALEMSRWLKEQGLTHGIDFNFYVPYREEVVRFRFHIDSSIETMFAMRWLGQ